tara:strand:- start:3728 stop:3952 length:225 start_codon:yes stop_codon:yes gene_type:complete
MNLVEKYQKNIPAIKSAPMRTTHIDIESDECWDLSSKCPYLFDEEKGEWIYENLNYERKEALRHIDDLKYILGL